LEKNYMGLLQDRIAVITGAGSGIGRAIAMGYAREGAQVVVVDVVEKAAADAAAEIKSAGGKADHFSVDVADRAACIALAKQVAEGVGQVSVLVNNAGIVRRNVMTGPADELAQDWDAIIATNLTGMFNVTHAFLEPLRASKGSIINMGSIQSLTHVSGPLSPAYTTSKHGVVGFTRALAAELGKDGVRANAIGPGFIETPLNSSMRTANPGRLKYFVDHTPIGRTGTPDDIVGPAIFLASDMSGYVTGALLMADGGYHTI
jgi:3-oxoacyl-[acyl-carrier protein] reductase